MDTPVLAMSVDMVVIVVDEDNDDVALASYWLIYPHSLSEYEPILSRLWCREARRVGVDLRSSICVLVCKREESVNRATVTDPNPTHRDSLIQYQMQQPGSGNWDTVISLCMANNIGILDELTEQMGII